MCMDSDPGKIRNGAEFEFDPPVASYWSQWLGHPAPNVLIVGQDFSNVDYFKSHHGRDDPDNPTNKRLRDLLGEVGIDVGMPPHYDPQARVFLTNAILCLKEGAMNAAVKGRWARACAETHLLPLTLRLRPPIVIGMGRAGWSSVRQIFGLKTAPKLISEAAGESWTVADQTRVFAVGHCGPLGIRNRPLYQQVADWKSIGAAVRSLHHPRT
jgi:hypothetical protein